MGQVAGNEPGGRQTLAERLERLIDRLLQEGQRSQPSSPSEPEAASEDGSTEGTDDAAADGASATRSPDHPIEGHDRVVPET